MRLVRLGVDHFGPIRAARLELGSGLNVLYGPNDLGKSSLAEAIRAVLLVAPASRSAAPYASWAGDETPRVELVFQTAPDAWWRLEKSFGAGARGKAVLDFSRDGKGWSNEAKQRAVDGKVRELLRWGVPGPGGKRAPKGIPATFLTTALLGRQEEVDAILDRRLDEDPDESGKERLSQALQALAQDESFRHILLEAQARVDEAFTASGGRKKGKSSPFRRVAEEVSSRREELETADEAARRSDAVRERVAVLARERMAAAAERDEAKRDVDELEQLARALAKRREVDARSAEVKKVDDAVAAAEEQEAALARSLEEVARARDAAAERRARAETELTSARETLRAAESEEGAAERELERQGLEKRILELDAAIKDAEATRAAAATAAERATAATALATAVAGHEEAVAALDAELASADAVITEAEAARARLEGVELWLRWTAASADLGEAEAAVAESERLRAEAAEKRSAAEKIDRELGKSALPTPDQLAALRALRRELDVAEARLGVGLTVTVRARRDLVLESRADATADSADAAERVPLAPGGEAKLDADRRLELSLGELADLVVEGGADDARREADRLRARWAEEAAPILAASEAVSIDALERGCAEMAERRREAEARRAEHAALLARADALGDVHGVVDERRRLVRARDEALGERDRQQLAVVVEELAAGGPAEVERLRGEAEVRLADARARPGDLAVRAATRREQLASSRRELTAAEAARDGAVAKLGAGGDGAEPWVAAAKKASADLDRLGRDRDTARAKLATLEEQRDGLVATARSRLTAAQEQLSQARAEEDTLEKRRQGTRESIASLRGELLPLRQAAERIDRDAEAAAVDALLAEIDGLPDPGRPVNDEILAAARERVARADAAFRDVEGRLHAEDGALRQVGGDVARERRSSAKVALERAREREADLELEYGAWQLLLEQLKEAESGQATHLGRALVDPVSARFAELTANRYGALDLGPHLETNGIQVAGDRRALGALSVGTREQLSTIFRLSLAEQLRSALLLDDQLTQSDPGRLEWFREQMRRSADEVQIIVITCRPQDYLRPDELGTVGGAEPVAEAADGLVRTIDLGRVIERAAPASD